MNAPLQAWFNQADPTTGHPISGDDELGALPLLLAAMMARRKSGAPPLLQRRRGVQGYDDLAAQLSGGFDPDEVLGAHEEIEDEEIDRLCADDEEVLGFDGDEDVSGSIERKEKRVAELRAKIAEHEAKMNAARPGSLRYRWHQRQVRRMKGAIERKQDKIKNKRARQQRRGRGRGAAAAGGAAAGAAAGSAARRREDDNRYERECDVSAEYYTTAPAGEIVSVPVLFNGTAHLQTVTFAAGAAAGTQLAFTGSTAQITFANFRVVGLKVSAWLRAAYQGSGTTPVVDYLDQTSQAAIRMTSAIVGGGFNLFYGQQQMSLGGRFGAQVVQEFRGIRAHPRMKANNTADIAGYVTNPFPTTATTGSFDVALSLDLLLDVLSDDVVDG